MNRGNCPKCGSDRVTRESGRWGYTGDWKCDNCGYTSFPSAFQQPERDCESPPKKITP